MPVISSPFAFNDHLQQWIPIRNQTGIEHLISTIHVYNLIRVQKNITFLLLSFVWILRFKMLGIIFRFIT